MGQVAQSYREGWRADFRAGRLAQAGDWIGHDRESKWRDMHQTQFYDGCAEDDADRFYKLKVIFAELEGRPLATELRNLIRNRPRPEVTGAWLFKLRQIQRRLAEDPDMEGVAEMLETLISEFSKLRLV